MQNYRYIAKDTGGNRKEGVRSAAGTGEVFEWLREQGLTPISISDAAGASKPAADETGRAESASVVAVKKKPSGRRPFQRESIKSSDLSAFCWQLTTMLEGGVPIATATEVIAEDVPNPALRRVLEKMQANMQRGISFSESIQEFPKIFNKIACAIILAGETGGNLPLSLHRLAEYFDSRDKLSKKIKGAMAYPVFVIFFIMLVVIFIMAFIIPRFRMIFEQIGTGKELPAFTRGFMAVYDGICSNLHFIIGFVVVTVVSLMTFYKRSKAGHYMLGKAFLSIPLIGTISSQGFIAMFCRTMSTLVMSGVPVLEVFDILAQMANNDIIRNAITRSKDSVIGGSNISAGMAASGFFPNMVIKMVQVGEESGSLPKVLERTAEFYERKVDTLVTIVMGLMEPIMILVVGAVVLVVVLALYLPIFSMG